MVDEESKCATGGSTHLRTFLKTWAASPRLRTQLIELITMAVTLPGIANGLHRSNKPQTGETNMTNPELKAERTREYILDTAREIDAERSKEHGNFSDNLNHTYEFWGYFLKGITANSNMPTEQECPGFYTGMFMAIHKMSRISNGSPNIEDFIDGTNYFAKAGELLLEWQSNKDRDEGGGYEILNEAGREEYNKNKEPCKDAEQANT